MTSQPRRYTQPDSTDTIAMILEVVFGLFGSFGLGLLGMGWLYVGHYLNFAAIAIGYLILLVIETVLIFSTFGCVWCVAIPLNISLTLISGVKVRDYVRRTGAKGHPINVLVVVLLGLCLIGCVITGIFFSGGVMLESIPTPQPFPTLAPFRP